MNEVKTVNSILSHRYGMKKPRSSRRTWMIAGGVVLLLLCLFGIWSTFFSPQHYVRTVTTGFNVIDDQHITVNAAIDNLSGKTLRCSFQALDENFVIVGWKEVDYPATQQNNLVNVSLWTERSAVGASVKECWVLG